MEMINAQAAQEPAVAKSCQIYPMLFVATMSQPASTLCNLSGFIALAMS